MTNASTIAGADDDEIDMPTHDGTDTMVGNEGDGYARILYIGEE